MLKALDNNNMKFERGSLQENNGFMSLSFLESVRKSINFIFSQENAKGMQVRKHKGNR